MTLKELLALLKPTKDVLHGVEWWEGWVPTEICRFGNFRDLDNDHVAALTATIAVETQLSAGLGVIRFIDLLDKIDEILREVYFDTRQGNHRLAVAKKLRRPLLIRAVLEKDATPALLNAMSATVEESNRKLDFVASLLAVRTTMTIDGVSAKVAASKHHIAAELVSRCDYVIDLKEDDPFYKLVKERKLKADHVAALKKAKPEDRLGYANRLIGGEGVTEEQRLTTKQLKELLATNGAKGTKIPVQTHRHSGNGVTIVVTYTDPAKAAAELAAASKAIASKKEKGNGPETNGAA